MSTDYYALTVLGVRAKPCELYEKVSVPNCPHEHEFDFCPKCGKKKMLVERKKAIDGFRPGEKVFRGLEVVCPIYVEDNKEDEECLVIGIVLGTADGLSLTGWDRIAECSMDTQIPVQMQEIRKKFEGSPFEGRKVSLFSVLRASY